MLVLLCLSNLNSIHVQIRPPREEPGHLQAQRTNVIIIISHHAYMFSVKQLHSLRVSVNAF